MRGDHNIQIKSVNQSDMLPSEEWRATHALTQAPKFDDGISVSYLWVIIEYIPIYFLLVDSK